MRWGIVVAYQPCVFSSSLSAPPYQLLHFAPVLSALANHYCVHTEREQAKSKVWSWIDQLLSMPIGIGNIIQQTSIFFNKKKNNIEQLWCPLNRTNPRSKNEREETETQTNKKIRSPLSDSERISRLERTVRIQSIAVFLIAVSVLVLGWRMYSFIQLNSDGLLSVTQSIQSVSDHVAIIDQQVDSICNILKEIASFLA